MQFEQNKYGNKFISLDKFFKYDGLDVFDFNLKGDIAKVPDIDGYWNYAILNDEGQVVYIGKTKRLRNRLYQHRRKKKIQGCSFLANKIDEEIYGINEVYNIVKHNPKHNKKSNFSKNELSKLLDLKMIKTSFNPHLSDPFIEVEKCPVFFSQNGNLVICPDGYDGEKLGIGDQFSLMRITSSDVPFFGNLEQANNLVYYFSIKTKKEIQSELDIAKTAIMNRFRDWILLFMDLSV